MIFLSLLQWAITHFECYSNFFSMIFYAIFPPLSPPQKKTTTRLAWNLKVLRCSPKANPKQLHALHPNPAKTGTFFHGKSKEPPPPPKK